MAQESSAMKNKNAKASKMITSEIKDGVCHAQVNGEMTIYTATECRNLLQRCLQSSQEAEINLAGVTEIDSAGVQLLIQAKREGARHGKPVRLVSHSPSVMEIIDLFRLAPEFGDLMIISP
jgi:anti-anti-sigma factor